MSGGGFVCTWKRPPLCLRCIKERFVFWEEVLNCGFKSDACLRTQRSPSLFLSASLSLSFSLPFISYFVAASQICFYLCSLATKVTSERERESAANKLKLHFSAVCHNVHRLHNLPLISETYTRFCRLRVHGCLKISS